MTSMAEPAELPASAPSALTMPMVVDSQPSNNVRTTTYNDLSLLYRLLRVTIKPFKPRLVSPGSPLPAGSPKLNKRPRTVVDGVRIEERRQKVDFSPPYDSIWLYDFIPSGMTISDLQRESKHTIYYFAGGGFQSPPSSEHWKFCGKLASELKSSNVRICLVSYPLAPNSPAVNSLPVLKKWAKQTLMEASLGTSNNIKNVKGVTDKPSSTTVSFMGDSAGGNVVLALGFWWAEELRRSGNSRNNTTAGLNDTLEDTASSWPNSTSSGFGVLKNLFVISPATDLRNQNPAIKQKNSVDPVLSIGLIDSVAQTWSKDTSTSDPLVSPNLCDFDVLRASRMRLHGVVGTHDVLAPDALVFKESCERVGVPGEWLVWDGQMHCFPLAGCYGLMEGKRGVEWIVRVLKENV